MKIEQIKIVDYGAIEDLNINFDIKSSEFLLPTILVGANGSGKSLFLSHIVDALVEMKRKKYNIMPEVQNDNYYRIGQKSYIRYGKHHSYVKVFFRTDLGNTITYTDIMTKDVGAFTAEYKEQEFQLNFNDPKFKEHGYFKNVSGDLSNEIDNNILLYFPSTRYSIPSWLNNDNNHYRFSKKQNFIGQSSRNIIKENVLNEIENWILNLVMDKHLYEIKTEKIVITNENGHQRLFDQTIFINGRNTQLLNMLNRLLTIIYKLKFPRIEYARIGVSSKENRKVVIIIKEIGVEEIEIAPTFGHLSSGEAMLISLFGSLLKEYDDLSNNNFTDIKEVSGIVLIDEIDLNLHINFAKEILPELISEFPKVQFLITTHSPFFLLGMDTNYKGNYKIYSLPNGQEINVTDFQEVQIAYETFLEGFVDFQNDFNELKAQLSIITKPLIITEGKTDWKHFKGVLERFKENGDFVELDIEFFECHGNSSLSDDKLNKMLLELAKVNLGKKIIGIFDSDGPNGKHYSAKRYTDLGNNVYAVSIPTPDFRNEHTEGISIEFLYNDEDLLKTDPNGRRIFLSHEFNENGRLKENLHIGVRNLDVVKKYLEKGKAKIVDSDVINIEGNSVALTKNTFAEYVLNKTEPFHNIDIEGFREVYIIMSEILFEK